MEKNVFKKEEKTATEVAADILAEQEINAAELLELSKKQLALQAELAQIESEISSSREELSKLSSELREKRKSAKEEAESIIKSAKEEAANRINEAKADAQAKLAQADNDAKNIVAVADEEANNKLMRAKNDAELKSQELRERSAALYAREEAVGKKEMSLAKLEARLSEREENAKKGFILQFEDERASSLSEADRIKNEIEKLKQEKLNTIVRIEKEMSDLRDSKIAEIEKDLKSRRDRLDMEIEANNNRTKELAALELERKALKDKMALYELKEEGIELRVKELVGAEHRKLLDEIDVKKNLLNKSLIEQKELQADYDALIIRFNNLKNVDNDALKAEIEDLKDKLKAEKQQVKELNDLLIQDGVDKNNLDEYKAKFNDYNNLQSTYQSLLKDYNQLKLEYEKKLDNEDQLAQSQKTNERLRKTAKQLEEELNKKRTITREERMEAIRRSLPNLGDIDNLPSFADDDIVSEIDWLEHIRKRAGLSGIVFSKRLLQSYHTSLKIGEWSPLVVFAGISGTGKSELPRQYALHGGMNFISVPVKPDWDSPQSLFGYYNSIENKFEATELLRALYQMQAKVKGGRNNQMLMVLLDEMNLAHVELYFSDLLSKFETKRGTKNGVVEYEIGLGAGADSEILQIGRNVLWTGTMNEDETTKALSDKVIDRSTLITFPRPKKLIGRRVSVNQDAKYVLEREQWEEWLSSAVSIESIDKADPTLMADLQQTVESINNKMSELGRNLGHRVWQGIQNYILNYPEVIEAIRKDDIPLIQTRVKRAFTEAVAFKIMPKLRGVETSGEYSDILDDIAGIINEKIDELSEDFKNARNLPTKIFMWHTAKFLEDENNS